MARYVAGKVAQYGALLFLALVLNFTLPRAMPGSPIVLFAGGDAATLTPAEKAEVLQRAGLDRPLAQQFGHYLRSLAAGDLGYSYRQKRPVADIVWERVRWTLLLAAVSVTIAAVLGVALGALAAWFRGSRLDVGLVSGAVFFQSLPSFWVGMLLVAVFATQLRLLPSFGLFTPGRAHDLHDLARHMVLPVTTMVVVLVGGNFLVTRYAMLTTLGEDYIIVARSKGMRERGLLFKHALRNALLPVLTVVMLELGAALSGATVVETVFSYPGLGRLVYEAVLDRDYPVLQAGFFVITLVVIAANLLADLAYPVLDPRVRGRG